MKHVVIIYKNGYGIIVLLEYMTNETSIVILFSRKNKFGMGNLKELWLGAMKAIDFVFKTVTFFSPKQRSIRVLFGSISWIFLLSSISVPFAHSSM